MWFGNLVTMRWFEDTWLQESFADYLGYRVADDGAGFVGAQARHEIGRKPEAYVADERRSTHPVAPLAEQVPDVDAALANFDSISYAKGNSVLRQLATWLGDEAFLAGLNQHLTRHRFGNATLADFLAALDDTSDRDVRGWAEVLAADGRVRHGLGRPHGRRARAGARRGPAPPLHRRRVRRPDAAAWRAAGRRGRGTGRAGRLGRRGRGAQRARRVVRAGPPRRAVGGRRGDVPLGRRGRPGADGAVGRSARPHRDRRPRRRGVPRAGGAPPPPRDRPHRRGRRRPPRPRAGGPAAASRPTPRARRSGGSRPRASPASSGSRPSRRPSRSPRGSPSPVPTRTCSGGGWPTDARTRAPPSTRGCAGGRWVGWRSSAPPTRRRSRRPGPPTAPPRPSWARRGRSPPARRRRPRRPPGWR